ncbi:uncharacterized protein LOC121731100 [Aricia agestis]|uniref:uncharacterized protein LOC121731100 n=1 Tax=Aricia agestis TaxID=91739 RepID=UPI001C2080FA|nr:uncharacterized protein LOC121731100 [Aricia agestis]
MEPSFEEAFDFDLNFIQQPVQNVMPNNKLRKAILMAKRKTIATDSLIKKYLAKKEIVQQSELMLNSAKEECKRVCIDYKNTLEKCTILEKELQTLDQKFKALESNYVLSQNQCEAMKCHANQLQSLVKENELKIESLLLENKLFDKKKEKESKGKEIKEHGFKKGYQEKGYSLLKKKNETFFKHILLFKDIIMGKTKLQKEHRLILNKYKKPKQEKELNDEILGDNYSSDEADFFDEVTPPPSNETLLSPYQNNEEKPAPLKVFKENIHEHCASNVSNGIHESELDSEDTGRGSSLAFSDSGKFFNSPDHCSNDPTHLEVINSKMNTERYLDASTNTLCNLEHKATSPLMFDDIALLSDDIGLQGNFFNMPDHYSHKTERLENIRCKINTERYLDASTNTSCILEHRGTSPLMFDDIALLSDDIGLQANTHSRPRIGSPEYFITDIPLSTEVVTIREKIKMVDCASSPIPELMDASLDLSKSSCKITIEDLMMDVSLSLNTEAGIAEDKLKTVDSATSPIQRIDRVHVSLSPIKFGNQDLKVNGKNNTDTFSGLNTALHDMENRSLSRGLIMSEENNYARLAVENINLPQVSSVDLSTNAVVEICENNTLETKCLEENNSDNLSSKFNDDKEIEMIFSSMRLEHRLLTPIPQTPLKSRNSICRKQHMIAQEKCTDHKCCKNIIRLQKKHLMLRNNYAVMERVIKTMKSSIQALTVLPLTTIDDKWANEGSVNAYSENEADRDEEEFDMHTQNNIECNNYYETMKSSGQNCTDQVTESLSQDIIEDRMDINDENLSLSEIMRQNANITKPKACRSIINKRLDPILSHDGSTNSDHNISEVRDVSPERIVSPVNVDNKRNNTQDQHHKIKSIKQKKLSKLEKLRHKMLPKYKISENEKNKSLRKKKSVVSTVKRSETDKLLKNKLAYEKAVKIMAEMKLKSKVSKNNKKINQFSGEKHDNTSSLHGNNMDKLMKGNDALQFEPVQKPDSGSEEMDSSVRRTTRSQCQNVGEINNEKQLTDNVNNTKNIENNDNIPINNTRELINETKSKIVKAENIEAKSDSPRHSMRNNRRTTRSQSKLSESEADTSLRQKQQLVIAQRDKSCEKLTEVQTFYSEEELQGKSNTQSQSKGPSVDLSCIKEAYNKDYTCHSKQRPSQSRKRSRDLCDEFVEPIPKRVLRSSKAKEPVIDNINNACGENNLNISRNIDSNEMNKTEFDKISKEETLQNKSNNVIDYSDLNISTTAKSNNCTEKSGIKTTFTYPKNSILCKSIDKYGKQSIRFGTYKVSEQVSNTICTKLEEDIAQILQMSADKINQGMKKLVEDLQKYPIKMFITGFMKYLKQPMRKQEMFKLMNTPPAPPMTKSEQILLFVIRQLKQDHSNIVESILENIEFCLFQLNRTPEFEIIESMSHFYAIVCRYFGLKYRLRLFLLDAMYCMSFKAVTVVKNCLEVWMHVLPLAHMGMAKSPLVTCLVYLLHFYKCEDKFKKIDVIRNILQHKYFYKITEMTEAKILEMFMNAVKEIKDVLIEKKILRTALIILAKRRGAVWCQKNIVKNMLLPIIEKEKCSDVSKQFAVSMLGPLVKPYPMDMKVHSEIIVNQLMDMLDQNPTDSMKEAIFTSLIFMSRQNHFRVTQALLNWEPEKVSQEFEKVIKDFVTEKPIKTWTKILPKMLFQQG